MLPHELIFHETEPYLTLETGLDDEEPQQDSKDSTQDEAFLEDDESDDTETKF